MARTSPLSRPLSLRPLTALLGLVALSVTPGCTTPDAYEPDDDPEQAQAITLGEVQLRNFHSSADIDYAYFETEPGNSYTFSTELLDSNLDTILYVFDADMNIIGENDDWEDLSSRVSLFATEATTWYILVDRYEVSTSAEYHLVAEAAVSDEDEYEPDDTLGEAGTLEPGIPQAHNLHSASDVDIMAFNGEAGWIHGFVATAEVTDAGVVPTGPNLTIFLIQPIPRP